MSEEPYQANSDLRSLLADYEHPTGELSAETLGWTLEEAPTVIGTLSLLQRVRFVTDAIAEAHRALRGEALELAEDADLNGELRLRVTCPGSQPESDDPPDAAADGTLTLRIPVIDGALGPAADGHASDCLATSAAVPLDWLQIPALESRTIRFSGPVALHFGQPVSLEAEPVFTPLFQIDRLEVEGLPVQAQRDFRLPNAQVLETRVVLPDGGTVIASWDGSVFALRERRGLWSCNPTESASCVPGF